MNSAANASPVTPVATYGDAICIRSGRRACLQVLRNKMFSLDLHLSVLHDSLLGRLLFVHVDCCSQDAQANNSTNNSTNHSTTVRFLFCFLFVSVSTWSWCWSTSWSRPC